jgi:hypothetical protein
MKELFFALLLFACLSLHAQTTLNVYFEGLDGSAQAFIPGSGTPVGVVDSGGVAIGTFDETGFLNSGAIPTGGNISQYFNSIGEFAFNTTGEVSVTGYDVTGTASSGDLLYAIPYEGLDLISAAHVGIYRNASTWVFPTNTIGGVNVNGGSAATAVVGSVFDSGGGEVDLRLTEAVPEPRVFALLAAACALGLVAWRRFRWVG